MEHTVQWQTQQELSNVARSPFRTTT